jgi:hypothetical protein
MARKRKQQVKGFETVTSWDNYKPLLLKALEATKGDIVEMGCGESSTPLLKEYGQTNNRTVHSYDSSEEYAKKYNTNHIINWSELYGKHKEASVILVDHSKGEDRGERLSQWKDFKGIAVCHDTEPSPCGGNYGWKFNEWKYVVHVKSPMNGDTNGTWATAVSQEYDLTQWVGFELGGYKIEC